jgi:hypothetical protein
LKYQRQRTKANTLHSVYFPNSLVSFIEVLQKHYADLSTEIMFQSGNGSIKTDQRKYHPREKGLMNLLYLKFRTRLVPNHLVMGCYRTEK